MLRWSRVQMHPLRLRGRLALYFLIKFRFFHKWYRVSRQLRFLADPKRMHDVRSDDHDQLVLTLLKRFAAEELADDRKIAKHRHLIDNLAHLIVHETCDSKTLPVGQFHFRVNAASGKRRDEETGKGNCVREIKGAHFRAHMQVDTIAFREGGSKRELHAVFTELNRDRRHRAGRAALNDRERKLAAGQEARFFAGFGKKVRLSKHLEQALLLERLDGQTYVNVGTEQENVQQAAESKIGRNRIRG